MRDVVAPASASNAAYVEHVAQTLLEATREARLLVSLRFEAKHTRELLKHMVDLHKIMEECGVPLDRGPQREVGALLQQVLKLTPRSIANSASLDECSNDQ